MMRLSAGPTAPVIAANSVFGFSESFHSTSRSRGPRGAIVSSCLNRISRDRGIHFHRFTIERNPLGLTGAIAGRLGDLQHIELAAREITPSVGRELVDVARIALADAVQVPILVEAHSFVRL